MRVLFNEVLPIARLGLTRPREVVRNRHAFAVATIQLERPLVYKDDSAYDLVEERMKRGPPIQIAGSDIRAPIY